MDRVVGCRCVAAGVFGDYYDEGLGVCLSRHTGLGILTVSTARV